MYAALQACLRFWPGGHPLHSGLCAPVLYTKACKACPAGACSLHPRFSPIIRIATAYGSVNFHNAMLYMQASHHLCHKKQTMSRGRPSC